MKYKISVYYSIRIEQYTLDFESFKEVIIFLNEFREDRLVDSIHVESIPEKKSK